MPNVWCAKIKGLVGIQKVTCTAHICIILFLRRLCHDVAMHGAQLLVDEVQPVRVCVAQLGQVGVEDAQLEAGGEHAVQ